MKLGDCFQEWCGGVLIALSARLSSVMKAQCNECGEHKEVYV